VSNPYPTNIAASIHAKLTNKAREFKIDPNILRTRYALERFLYRLGQSQYKRRLTLKGAMLFVLWSDENFRPIKDADFLLTGESGVDASYSRVLCPANPRQTILKFPGLALYSHYE